MREIDDSVTMERFRRPRNRGPSRQKIERWSRAAEAALLTRQAGCEKKPFHNKAEAEGWILRHQGRGCTVRSAYRCDNCGQWHMTSQPHNEAARRRARIAGLKVFEEKGQ